MDEPFGAVDPIVREHLQDEFLRIRDRLGTTVVFVTHDIDEAIKMGTRVAVMEVGGRLAQYSPPWELLARPASDYVARFVGADRALKRLALVRLRDLELESSRPGQALQLVLAADLTAREALAALLAAPDDAARVLDGDGRERGVVTVARIAALLQIERAPAPAG
jgi:osmoprotectant transport system ATP-binding protein